MSRDRHFPQISTLDLKLQIERRLGHQKADKYFNLLNRYLTLKLSKLAFDKLCIELLGRENIILHNGFLRAIIRNATISKTPPKHDRARFSSNSKVPNGYPRTLRDPSLKKTNNVGQQQSATELLSLGSRPPAEVTSVEEGEEVEQFAGSPGIHSKAPLRAPLGISHNVKGNRKVLTYGSSPYVHVETCCNTGELPDTGSLRKMLEQKLETEGLNVSSNCVNLLNNGLDVFMKRLLQPCLDLAASRCENKVLDNLRHHGTNKVGPMPCLKKLSRFASVSMLDFKIAMESNPMILGEDWPVQLEKISLGASEDCMDV